MSDTKIEWADKVWNPITGCTPISEGCQNCYAARMAKRLAKNPALPHRERYEGFKVAIWPERLSFPLRWRKPSRIFVNSMGDLFHEDVPDSWIDEVFETIHRCAAYPIQNIFMILTKRPERMKEYVNKSLIYKDHLWLGVTAENQEAFNERVSALLNTHAAKWFISAEPILGPIDFRPFLRFDRERKWVILGGETGPKARPVLQSWIVAARNQCHNHEVPFFFKGWGTGTLPKKSPLYDKINGHIWKEFPK